MLAKGKAQALVVAKLDRLTRSVRDLGTLVDTRFAAGRLVLNVLASVAQWEREAIGERTAAAMAHKRTKGERVGAVPYGYRLAEDGCTLMPVDAEQAVVVQARELRRAGLSLRKICAKLVEREHRSRTDRAFAPAQVQRMLAA
jgi:DNA invertase Pin-like site-specific DNA recombinase